MDSGRKITGGKYHKQSKRRLYERRNQERVVVLGATKSRQLRVRGGGIKKVLLATNKANLLAGDKTEQAEITNVEETPQNRFLARQNRLMKGVVIATSKGRARITNRPSQEGLVNAVLMESK